ncbi:hypothetical protein [Xylanibacter ruminicola]|uniref:hypothetical protein n=1 Tax=Xylanibacter ruminicola TaxID=839 RepID=UPI0008A7501C|nr:hypothetical protein [Xylanibacter ruminicola]SEI02238.1 hypothetical protein SAMN02745192_2989 [Xylanibacter ruminicola]
MKYFSRSLYSVILFSFCLSLAACKTVRTSEKAVSASETAAVTASRLTFYRTIDSLSRQFSLSADSISMIFFNESQEFPTAFPSAIESWLETPSDSLTPQVPNSHQRPRDASRPVLASPFPKSLHIYGLHLGASTKEKSVTATDLKDSVAVATQSQKFKSAKADKSAPASAHEYIALIFIFTIVLYIIHRFRISA